MAKKKAINPEEMTDEEIEAFNAEQEEKRAKLLAKQANNRAKARALEERDPSVIRGIKGKDQILCVCVRRVGLDDDEMAEVGEEINLPKDIASRLQDSGAVKVKL